VQAPDKAAVSHAAPPGSTFTFTLSFRDLPSGPLLAEATSPVPWVCNSSVNPTIFRVFHVTNVVKRINSCTGQVVATINVPNLPLQVRVSPDGSQAAVTSYSGAITFINTATNTVSSSIQPNDPNFAPDGIAFSPDGSYALVTNYLTPPYAYLAVVDTATMKITSKIPLNTEYPESVFINSDGTLAWVTDPWDNNVEVVDILTGTIVQELRIYEPFSIVFNPTGTRAFVSSGTLSEVAVIDTTTYQVIQTVPAGSGAMDLQITPDGAFIYVNNSTAQSITVIDTQSLKSTTTNIGGTPQGSALVPSQ
jgi:YVTN family beta-propeller protein